MEPKNKRIAIIGPYGAICGVSEYQRFLVEAFERAGVDVTVLANRFSSGYKSCGLHDERQVCRVFGTGHAPAEERFFEIKPALDAVLAANAKVCYLNYQDYLYPDKAGLFQTLSSLAAKGVALYLIVHDTCLPQHFPFSLFRGIITPSEQVRSNRYPTAGKVHCIPQGIPVFPQKDKAALRKDLVLCDEKDLMITTFGLGRTNNAEVLKAAKDASKIMLLPEDHPIFVQMLFAAEDDFHVANEAFSGEYSVYLNGGYLEDYKLADYIQASDAVVINYPQITQYATSSALRFALGTGSLVFARQSNWFADVKNLGLYIPFDSVPSLTTQLVHTFQSEESRRAAAIKVGRVCELCCR